MLNYVLGNLPADKHRRDLSALDADVDPVNHSKGSILVPPIGLGSVVNVRNPTQPGVPLRLTSRDSPIKIPENLERTSLPKSPPLLTTWERSLVCSMEFVSPSSGAERRALRLTVGPLNAVSKKCGLRNANLLLLGHFCVLARAQP
ncbi:hypothetical protein AVEN_176015-1 [Araneus ventricosus]|uniref:Uncharacterized protein n=1 Tax=Araneus ventricosus TaxID=182803 RepID=A0A4Y2SU11_ARAVE|nr:hypothetical protein AVEN_176015-1 [Araneus ventricosus]